MPAPPKPWEKAGSAASRASLLGSSSADDGQAKPWETQSTVVAGDATTSQAAPSATRPWDRNTPNGAMQPYQAGSNLTGYNSQLTSYGGPYSSMPSTSYGTYNGAYNTGNYGSPYSRQMGMYGAGSMYGGGGLYGNTYGSGMYGNTTYGGYGNTMYGSGGAYGRSPYFGGSVYGGGLSPMMGPGPGQVMGPDGVPIGPNNPQTRWEIFMSSINGLMHFFGRLSFLVDENAHAVHFFITALLQLLDRASYLYGEIARFVLRLLGYKEPKGRGGNAAGQANSAGVPLLPAPSPVESFDSLWPSKST